MSGTDAVGVVTHVGLSVADLDRAERFYTGALGFVRERDLDVPDGVASRLLRVPEPVGLRAVYLRLGDFVLELLRFDRPGNDSQRERSFTEPGLTHLSMTVSDLAGVRARVVELGGEILEDTDVGAAVLVRDPDGQIVELLPARG